MVARAEEEAKICLRCGLVLRPSREGCVGVLVLKMALPWVGLGKCKEEAMWYSAWILEEHKTKPFGRATLLDMCGRDNVCVHQRPFPFFLDA